MDDARSKVKERFEEEGVSIASWARSHGFNVITVYRVLNGRIRGKRGEAHDVAVALGIKEEPKELKFRSGKAA